MLRLALFDTLQTPAAPSIFPRVAKHRKHDVREANANQNANDGQNDFHFLS
jgi:hypothetical protein